MIIDCIADLHGSFPKLKSGDLLIVAGDITANDKVYAWCEFYKWLNTQDYKKKVYIGGNHDYFLTQCANNQVSSEILEKEDLDKHEYLCDSSTEFEGLKIWGCPWAPWVKGINPKCAAFMGSENYLKSKWDLIPQDTDILITHTPPHGILDKIIADRTYGRDPHAGSISLKNLVLDASYFKNLKLHVFGHIHEFGGKVFKTPLTKFVNASLMNENYQFVNKPVRIEL